MYQKPLIISENDIAEGVFTASGLIEGAEDQTGSEPQQTNLGNTLCESQYMLGVWKGSDWSNWQGTNYDVRGCEGCPANWNDGVCHANSDPGFAEREDLRPSWEKEGKGPNDPCQ